MIGDDKKLILNYTLGEVTEHILSKMPNGEKIHPEDRYVKTQKLKEIMKVSGSMICEMGEMGMKDYAGYGDDLWDYVKALEWRKEIYYKKIVKKRGRKKKE
jgi:hypothetical protein